MLARLEDILIAAVGFLLGSFVTTLALCLCNASRDGDDRARWCRLHSALGSVITNSRWAIAVYGDKDEEADVVTVPLKLWQCRVILDAFGGGG